MNKVTAKEQLAPLFHDGMSLMVGGFLGCGVPYGMIEYVLELGIKNIHLICSDTGEADQGVGRLISQHRVRSIITSHIGTNKDTIAQLNSGEVSIDLIPQGTFNERIRAAGSGIGGFLTRVGVGTPVAEGKEVITVNGVDYLLEYPLTAEVALVRGSITDTYGNTCYKGTTKNCNTVMAMAAQKVIMESEIIVAPAQLEKEKIMTPGLLVDHIVKGEPRP